MEEEQGEVHNSDGRQQTNDGWTSQEDGRKGGVELEEFSHKYYGRMLKIGLYKLLDGQ